MNSKNYKDVKLAVISSLQTLHLSPLRSLKYECFYNGGEKEEFIIEMAKVIEDIIKKGFSSLEVEPSQCKFCFPTADTFNFNNPQTGELIIRYVIHEETMNSFIVEECRNKILPEGEHGLPF